MCGGGGRGGEGGLAPSFRYANLPCPHLGIRVSEDRHHANTTRCVQMGEGDARVWFSSGVGVWDVGLTGAPAPSFRTSNLPCPEVGRPVHTASTASTAQ